MNNPWFAALVVGVPIILVAIGGVLRTRRENRKRLATQLAGVRLMRRLKQLMEHVQTHRGLVSMIRNGASASALGLAGKQSDIERELQQLRHDDRASLLLPGRWRRVQDHWTQLSGQLDSLDAAESFERHSALVRQILFLMSDLADQARLQELPDGVVPGGSATLIALWSTLPDTAEAIGQARAVGAGVAAAQHCSSVARIKLRFLHQQVSQSMVELSSTTGTGSGFAERVAALLRELDRHLLQPATPSISAERYFGLASDALRSVYADFERRAAQLESRLAAQV